jgi:4-hydroxy-tetrahydrodipicolinate synthase
MFIESNPVPVKTAAGLMGKCGDEVRLPLAPMLDANKAKLMAVMKQYKLI